MPITLKKIGFIFLCLSLITCKKKEDPTVTDKLPVVDFSFDKAEYQDGESMQLTSNCTETSTFRWTLPDGTTSASKNTSFLIPKTGLDRVLSVRLDAFSANGIKTNYAVKNITVKAITSQVLFYAQYSNYSSNYAVSVDGVSIGTLNVPYSATAPDCSQTNFPIITLKTGSHVIQYKNANSYSYSVLNVVISETNCNVIAFN